VLHGAALARPRAWREQLAWRHPEWWTLGLSGIAWLMLLYPAVLSAGAGHWSHARLAAAPVTPLELWPRALADWMLMVVAMMVPLVVDSVRGTATRSLWRRRQRAIAGFLIGYLAPWLVVGALVSVVEVLGRPGSTVAVVGFALAAVWQLSPRKWRALQACHRTAPLAPRGWRADRDCLRYGWSIGRTCVLSCWALMLACVLAGHSLPALACASVVALAERYVVRPEQTFTFSLLFGTALVYGILSLA